ncbi:YT521-B-like domain-containing protein [Vararia minispora EC-137]|uniref:YT521-B-like domain-containing protein n=1 Tax=Vararia minispora EC-137 TaxID=1314806 RepID=A0ACB8QJD6_9AGAM|nr:YT521-B-like domain-containing protein [Vararia minispora EC-137]
MTPSIVPWRQPASSTPARLGGMHEERALSPMSPLRASPLSPAAPALQSVRTGAPSSVSDHADNSYERKPYHPNPPAHRSEWVMWAGNVPSDATHDELWRFFSQAPPPPTDPGHSSPTPPIHGGVSSIFLISRSNCAFINFESEEHLEAATQHFNGLPLRPTDSRCPRLVCRVRRRTDDLKAGVGGQRGMGMHTRWVKEQRARAAGALSPSVSSPEDELGQDYAALSLSDDEGGRRGSPVHTASSGSFTSSSSGFLQRFFPQRYFILKSLTQYDLDLSVQKGVWATQRHNEGILDQAFRTSKDVFLIFGVNKSGEFYGYARMASGIQHSEDRIPWEARTQSGSGNNAPILSPGENRFTDSSPQPVSGFGESIPHASQFGDTPAGPGAPVSALATRHDRKVSSAPAEMREPHHQLSHRTPSAGHSLNVKPVVPSASVPATTFQLDTTAPVRAIRNPAEIEADLLAEARPSLASVIEAPSQESLQAYEHPLRPDPVPLQRHIGKPEDDLWGQSFEIEWIKTERLPFYRTRHLRNPWNHGREVKVSRDGTELEPGVGRELLAEWDRPPPEPGDGGKPPPSNTAGGRRGSRPASYSPLP